MVVALGVLTWRWWNAPTPGVVEQLSVEGWVVEGNEWVEWENSSEGVRAKSVHPLIAGNPLLRGLYVEEGDLLRKVDFNDVFDAEVVNQIVRNAPPGTVLLFQVDRVNPVTGEREWKNLFIENSFEPAFSFSQSRPLWTLFPWVAVFGAFLSLISLFIIFPIIRTRFLQSWPLFGVILFSFLVFSTLLIRHLNLLVRTEYSELGFERLFTITFMGLILLHGLVSLRSRLTRWWRLILLADTALALFFIFQLLQPENFPATKYPLPGHQRFILGFLLIHVFGALLLSVVEKWKGRSQIDKAFHLLSVLYVAPLLLGNLLVQPGGSGAWLIGEPGLLLAFGTVMIPMISATASQLKFGRVSVVLTSSLQYVLFFGMAILLFYLLRTALASLGVQFKYQSYLEIAGLLVAVLILRWVYRLNEARLRKYIVLVQQERRNRIDGFIARIPQYTSSHQLLDDLVAALRDYFGATKVGVWMVGQEGTGSSPGIAEEQLGEIYRYLQMEQVHWAASRQIDTESFPAEVERALAESDYAYADTLTINDDIYGLLLIGSKKRGVYNLDDLEIISRIIQQTQLTLGVLHLLEREKSLLQKNYEANLTALRSQINPHFLFNTLNTISALIHDAPDDAEEAVEKLAFIFRYTLKQSSRSFVTVKEEMTLVRTYLEIEHIRFGERLELIMEVDRKMEDVEIPAFVVQTIVENAIKHGIAKIMGKGYVAIRARENDGFLEMEVEDNGPGIEHEKITTSTGLNNIMTRLEQIYETKNLLYFENTGQGTRVTIKIPLAT